jgi:hypothetical protein
MPSLKPNPVPSSPNPKDRCVVESAPDEGMIVHFYIDPLRAKRLRSRMGTKDPGDYLWSNVINRAVESEVF